MMMSDNKAKLETALIRGDIYAIGGSVYDAEHQYLFSTSELADLRNQVSFGRIDAGGRPTWRAIIHNPPNKHCKHNRTGYCFDCVRERHNQDILDGKFDDMDDDYASTPHPSAHHERSE